MSKVARNPRRQACAKPGGKRGHWARVENDLGRPSDLVQEIERRLGRLSEHVAKGNNRGFYVWLSAQVDAGLLPRDVVAGALTQTEIDAADGIPADAGAYWYGIMRKRCEELGLAIPAVLGSEEEV